MQQSTAFSKPLTNTFSICLNSDPFNQMMVSSGANSGGAPTQPPEEEDVDDSDDDEGWYSAPHDVQSFEWVLSI